MSTPLPLAFRQSVPVACPRYATMDLFSYSEWQRLKGFQVDIALIAGGFLALVTILGCLVYKLGGHLSFEKISAHPYVRFAYVCLIKPHDHNSEAGQQSALESFYAAQVGHTLHGPS